jgi:hypothetical protein
MNQTRATRAPAFSSAALAKAASYLVPMTWAVTSER